MTRRKATAEANEPTPIGDAIDEVSGDAQGTGQEDGTDFDLAKLEAQPAGEPANDRDPRHAPTATPPRSVGGLAPDRPGG